MASSRLACANAPERRAKRQVNAKREHLRHRRDTRSPVLPRLTYSMPGLPSRAYPGTGPGWDPARTTDEHDTRPAARAPRPDAPTGWRQVDAGPRIR